MTADELLRIGEVSRRSGVSPPRLRAWEQRYGLLRPTRSSGGLRLYSSDDVERVRLMRRHLDRGLAAAEAAALALRAGGEPERAALAPSALRAELAEALDRFDEPAAQAVIDRLLATATVDTLLREVVLPYLHELGERWQRGDASVAQEHFASGVLRGRLLGLARGWGLGVGPIAVLACLPGEQHDLGLIAFGLALRERGWRIVYLGPDAPPSTVEDAARRLDAQLVVLHAIGSDHLRTVAGQVRELAARRTVALAGPIAEHATAATVDSLLLTGDPVAEAERVADLASSSASRASTPSPGR